MSLKIIIDHQHHCRMSTQHGASRLRWATVLEGTVLCELLLRRWQRGCPQASRLFCVTLGIDDDDDTRLIVGMMLSLSSAGVAAAVGHI